MEVSVESFAAAAPSLFSVAYRVGFRLLGTREDAQDVAQEALARALVRWSAVGSYADAWVARTATNLALDLHRRRRLRRGQRDLGSQPASSVHADRLDLLTAVGRLPRRQRDAVVLRYLADMDEASVASVMGCSAGTVKQHVHRAVIALRADPLLAEPGA